MSGEVKKEKEACADCVAVGTPFKRMPVWLWVTTLVLIAFGWTMFFWGEGREAFTTVLIVALIFFGMVSVVVLTMVYCLNVAGRYLYCFVDKDEQEHVHVRALQNFRAKLTTQSGKKVLDLGRCDYYCYIPPDWAGGQEELFEKCGVDGPILQIPDGGWFKKYAILSSGNKSYREWTIDRAAKRNDRLTVRLRHYDDDSTAMIVTPRQAIAIMELCRAKSSEGSPVGFMLKELKRRQFHLDDRAEIIDRESAHAARYEALALDGWARLELLKALLYRLSDAILQTKGKASGRVAAMKAREALGYILESEEVFCSSNSNAIVVDPMVVAGAMKRLAAFEATLPSEQEFLAVGATDASGADQGSAQA